MAIKLAKAMGANVTAITHSENKVASAKDIGADNVIISTNENDMNSKASSLNLIINTVPVKHDVTQYMPLLDVGGTLVIAKHNIHPDCELIDIKDVNTAFQRLIDGSVAHRLVIDMQTLGI